MYVGSAGLERLRLGVQCWGDLVSSRLKVHYSQAAHSLVYSPNILWMSTVCQMLHLDTGNRKQGCVNQPSITVTKCLKETI